jgi:hypothetical protein
MNIKQITIIALSTVFSVTNSYAQKAHTQVQQDFLTKTALESVPTYCALCEHINQNPDSYTTEQKEACNTQANTTIIGMLLELKSMEVPFNESTVEAVYQASNVLYSLVPEEEIGTLSKETTSVDEQIKKYMQDESLTEKILSLLEQRAEKLSAEQKKLERKLIAL